MINVRAESLSEKPSFNRLVDKRRCLIPADGFYEWRKDGKRKQPVWIHLKSREPFAFAGLWEVWKKPDDKIFESFTIITCPPNDLLKPIHDRMPAILKPEDEGAWLDISAVKFNSAQEFLTPFPSELMDAHDVSPLVNSPNNDRAQCIEPIQG